MIWLRSAKSANFYKKRRRLPKAAITELFRTIRQNSDTPSQNVFHHVKQPLGHASWSAIAFFYERAPSFLELPEGHARERVRGFLMLVEYREHVVFKSGLDLPSTFKTDYLRRAGDDRVEGAIAHADATFEQIRLRNMATSKYALRSKTLEANDLRTVVGPSGVDMLVDQKIESSPFIRAFARPVDLDSMPADVLPMLKRGFHWRFICGDTAVAFSD